MSAENAAEVVKLFCFALVMYALHDIEREGRNGASSPVSISIVGHNLDSALRSGLRIGEAYRAIWNALDNLALPLSLR